MRREVSGRVLASSFQLVIDGCDGWFPDGFYAMEYPMIGNFAKVADGFVMVFAGTDHRYVGVNVVEYGPDEILEVEPLPSDDGAEADVELSASFENEVRVCGLDDLATSPETRVDGTLRKFRLPPGKYRIRIQNTGFAKTRDERLNFIVANPQTQPLDPKQLTEQFTIHIWPESNERPPIVYKALSTS